MSERFYLNRELAIGPVTLDGPEAHHLAHVRRLGTGAEVVLFDGGGQEWLARVVAIHRGHVDLDVVSCRTAVRELSFPLTVAAPLPRGDRGQFLVEKLTELGVTRYLPIITSRTVRQPSDAKQAKLERYVVEACKQCGRNRLMAIGPPTRFDELLQHSTDTDARFLATPDGAPPAVVTSDRATLVAVGPEGGWTDEEIAAARQAGWQLIGLGPRVLRVETAAVALASWFALGAIPPVAHAPGSPASEAQASGLTQC